MSETERERQKEWERVLGIRFAEFYVWTLNLILRQGDRVNKAKVSAQPTKSKLTKTNPNTEREYWASNNDDQQYMYGKIDEYNKMRKVF